MTRYRTADVARLTGATLRQLQWWDEQQLTAAHIDGHRRYYVAEDVLLIAVIVELRRKGITSQKALRLFRSLRTELLRQIAWADRVGEELHLLTDGRELQFVHGSQGVLDYFKRSKNPVVVVGVTNHWERINLRRAS